jgi:hypothetical protein
MNHLLIRHKVADYDRWVAFYESTLTTREVAGLHEKNRFRNVNDPNEVFLLFAFKDLMKAEEYVARLDYPPHFEAAGVVDRPDFWFLT